jgi:hypothetical protein
MKTTILVVKTNFQMLKLSEKETTYGRQLGKQISYSEK